MSWTFYGDILNYSFISSIEMLVVLIKLVLILLKQAKLVWTSVYHIFSRQRKNFYVVSYIVIQYKLKNSNFENYFFPFSLHFDIFYELISLFKEW